MDLMISDLMLSLWTCVSPAVSITVIFCPKTFLCPLSDISVMEFGEASGVNTFFRRIVFPALLLPPPVLPRRTIFLSGDETLAVLRRHLQLDHVNLYEKQVMFFKRTLTSHFVCLLLMLVTAKKMLYPSEEPFFIIVPCTITSYNELWQYITFVKHHLEFANYYIS